jgi:hypothetical protein
VVDIRGSWRVCIWLLCATMAELVDAVDSKSTAFTGIPVQVRVVVPKDKKHLATH